MNEQDDAMDERDDITIGDDGAEAEGATPERVFDEDKTYRNLPLIVIVGRPVTCSRRWS